MKKTKIILALVLATSILSLGACNREKNQKEEADSAPQQQGGSAPSKGGTE